MTEPSDAVARNSSVSLWLAVLLAIILAAGSFYWTNHKFEALRATAATPAAPAQHSDSVPIKQAIAALQQTVQDVQLTQQRLADELNELQRKLASEEGDRKLLSEQLGALSSRVDAMASANAESAPSPAARNRRSRR